MVNSSRYSSSISAYCHEIRDSRTLQENKHKVTKEMRDDKGGETHIDDGNRRVSRGDVSFDSISLKHERTPTNHVTRGEVDQKRTDSALSSSACCTRPSKYKKNGSSSSHRPFSFPPALPSPPPCSLSFLALSPSRPYAWPETERVEGEREEEDRFVRLSTRAAWPSNTRRRREAAGDASTREKAREGRGERKEEVGQRKNGGDEEKMIDIDRKTNLAADEFAISPLDSHLSPPSLLFSSSLSFLSLPHSPRQ